MKNRKKRNQAGKKNGNLFAITENNFGTQSIDQETDCWNTLWQQIKAEGSRIIKLMSRPRQFVRTKEGV